MLKKLLLPACFAPIGIALLLSACSKNASTSDKNDVSAALSSALAARSAQSATETGGITRTTVAPSLRTLMYGTTLESFQTLGTDGAVNEVGIFVPLSVIEQAAKEKEIFSSAPAELSSSISYSISSEPASVVQLDLPVDVKKTTYLDHVEVVYTPSIAQSKDPYAPGHFSFHFFTVTPDQQNKISCAQMLDVSADRFADSYAMDKPGLPPTGDCVPFFGNRAIDITSPEQDLVKHPTFTHTLAMQYYSGRIVALTPMITSASLLTKKSFTQTIKLPITIGKETLFPTKFTAKYDAGKKAYKLSFSDWVMMR